MASKKDKYLESAQRFMLKGQLDKAIKEYQQVVVLEPKEIRYRQKLAELLVRDNRRGEAITQYEGIGKHYAENSYFLKAIAVYKQIQRLTPEDNAISLTLASLNHQQGLTGNALAEYGQVVTKLEKEGALAEAVKVLEQMLVVDREHLATRLKYAELLFATDALDASYQAFSALLKSLRTGGDLPAAQKIESRVDQLFPGRQGADLDVKTVQLFAGEVQEPASSEEREDLGGIEPQPMAQELTSVWDSAGAGSQAPLAVHVQATRAESSESAPWESNASWADELPLETEASLPLSASMVSPVPASDSAWEEEIELDLEDDPPDSFFAQPPDLASSLGYGESDLTDQPSAAAQEAGDSTDTLNTALWGELPSFDELPLPAESSSPDGLPCFTDPYSPGGHVAQAAEVDTDTSLELTFPEDSELHLGFGWADEETEPEEAGTADLPYQAEPVETAEAETIDAADAEPAVPTDFEALAERPAEDAGVVQDLSPVRGWEEIFPDLGETGDALIDAEELESHYDLGIAYKEMGLYSAAIKEFTVAAGNPQRRLDCLTLQAICLREKGDPEKAEELLLRGLELGVLSAAERVSLSYELGYLFEAAGHLDKAIGLYREVHKVNPAFHDVSARLSDLAGDEPLDIIDLDTEEEGA